MKSQLLKRRRNPSGLITRPQDFRNAFIRLACLLGAVSAAHVLAMAVFEGLTPFEGIWLTMTTFTSVGYGDYAAETIPGRLATMLLMFLGGIWLAFRTAAVYFDYRADRRERMHQGRWRWTMDDHIVILNVPSRDWEEYIARLVGELRETERFRETPIELVSRSFTQGLPPSLRNQGVVHQHADAWDSEALRAADAERAAAIVVLAASENDPVSDSVALDIVDRLRGLGAKGTILAECVHDANRARLLRFGADLVLRPLRGYPEMIVRALVAPGTERILEDLFTSKGEELMCYAVRVAGWTWCELVAGLLREDVGLAVGYRRPDGEIVVNPPAATEVEADTLFLLVREGKERADGEVAALIDRLGRAA